MGRTSGLTLGGRRLEVTCEGGLMVSRYLILLFAAMTGWAQTPIAPLSFRQESPGPTPATQTNPQLTVEMRGDIQMARKMFREAVETYSAADQNSPIIANKIGIAYHQMLELELAKRNYERAAKLDPK